MAARRYCGVIMGCVVTDAAEYEKRGDVAQFELKVKVVAEGVAQTE